MNRIIFIAFYNEPESGSSLYYLNDIKKFLINNGNEVTTICPNPVRGLSKKSIIELKNQIFVENEFGKVVRLYANSSGNLNIFNRLLRSVLFVKKVVKYLEKNQSDFDTIVIPSFPSNLILHPIFKISKKIHKKIIFSINDIWPDILLKNKIGNSFLKRNCDLANEIITISEDMKNTLISKEIPCNKIHVISIWNWESNNEKSKLKNTHCFAYIGNVGIAQNVEFLVEIAKALEKESVHFRIIGSGKRYKKIENKIKKYNLKNISITGKVSLNVAANLYNDYFANIIILRKNVIKYACPSKTSMCLYSQSQLFCILDDCEYSKYLQKCGAVVNTTYKVQSIVTDLLKLIDNPRTICDIEKKYDKNLNLIKWGDIISC